MSYNREQGDEAFQKYKKYNKYEPYQESSRKYLKTAIAFWKKAVDEDQDGKAAKSLAEAALLDNTIKRSLAISQYITWLKTASDLGNYDSSILLAKFYHKGKNVLRDVDEAIFYYSRAVQQKKQCLDNAEEAVAFQLGKLHKERERYNIAIAYFIIAAVYYEAKGDKDSLAHNELKKLSSDWHTLDKKLLQGAIEAGDISKMESIVTANQNRKQNPFSLLPENIENERNNIFLSLQTEKKVI